jgi:FkbM family methyltransferase
MPHAIQQHGVVTTFTGTYGRMYGDCFSRNTFYEQDFLEHIRSLGLTGTYLDIGSNIGNHALYFARLCNADRVYAFEPLTHYAQRVADNIAINAMDHSITLMRFGLADVTASRTIAINGGQHDIQTRRLDDLNAEVAGRVSLMKIDVEGMEEQVLHGGLERIARDRPIIYAEANSDDHLARIGSLLAGCGYVASGRHWNASPTYEFVPR